MFAFFQYTWHFIKQGELDINFGHLIIIIQGMWSLEFLLNNVYIKPYIM